jgi:hypothetical protein
MTKKTKHWFTRTGRLGFRPNNWVGWAVLGTFALLVVGVFATFEYLPGLSLWQYISGLALPLAGLYLMLTGLVVWSGTNRA